jgi:hypothetical protein
MAAARSVQLGAGLIEDHPIRFTLAWLQLIVGWRAVFLIASRLKRYR